MYLFMTLAVRDATRRLFVFVLNLTAKGDCKCAPRKRTLEFSNVKQTLAHRPNGERTRNVQAAHSFSIAGMEIVRLRFVGCETDGVKLYRVHCALCECAVRVHDEPTTERFSLVRFVIILPTKINAWFVASRSQSQFKRNIF